MSAGYLLSVDLGTSHTVAVMHWPDGRSRPLLFDGSPVLPSAIYLDDAGTIHVGKDAQRLAAGDPGRFEPNPKQRIDEGTLLLGDREISVATAFAAILSRVARQAVEAVGGLPEAVLTCPAAWGEQRRSVLIDASAQAGYRPPQIVTEPVAAANYYSTSLNNSLPAGSALAVFDFGGGTLDIAVVGREQDGTLSVLADGGLADLGGLDIDGVLVEHVGKNISSHDEDAWKQLQQPSTPIQLRNRRALWDDVRGAKEMLSRTSVAPVNVPGLDAALHLTRAELEEVAKPLLARAVAETEQVLGHAGRDSTQLAGIFLVGGSSRMPLVAKMLHSQTGIAPTALEQPEIPVAEGALSLVAPSVSPPPQFTPPLGTNPNYIGPGMSPVTSPQQGLPPHSPSAPQQPDYNTVPLGRPKKDRRKLFALLAAIAVLAIVIPLAVYWFTSERYDQRPFNELEALGSEVAYSASSDDMELNDFSDIRIRDGKAIFSYVTRQGSVTEDQTLYMQALDTETGEDLWEHSMSSNFLNSEVYAGNELFVVTQENDISEGFTFTFIDVENGTENESLRRDNDGGLVVGENLVTLDDDNGFQAYNAEGNEVASWDYPDDDAGVHNWGEVNEWEAEAEPRGHNSDAPSKFWVLTDDGTFHVNDIDSGEGEVSDRVEGVDDQYYVFEDHLFVVTGDVDYQLNVYDLETLEPFASERVRDFTGEVTEMRTCGSSQICIEEEFENGQNGYRVYDTDEQEFVHLSDEEQDVSQVRPVGLHLAVQFEEGDSGDVRTQILDQNFEEVANVDSQFWPIDGASLLYRPFQDAGSIAASYFDEQFIGLGVDGDRQLMGSVEAYHPCAYDDTRIACFTEDGPRVYSFRD